jgi:hypothetical protein
VLGFGTKSILRGGALRRRGVCTPGTGWHDWTFVSAAGGRGRLYCDGEEVANIKLPGGYVVDPGCGFVIGGKSHSGCSAVLTKSKLVGAADMVLVGA